MSSLDMPGLAKLLSGGPTPLFATVSGAHLYGFESEDSDVDLRGAFVLPLSSRLSLHDAGETVVVEREVGGVEVDWVAHDVRKFATLMTRRNGYVLEQLYSPLIVTGGERLRELRRIGSGCIVRHLVHHYRGFAHTKRGSLASAEATVKDLLYAYRVYLTGIHVLRSGRIEANLLELAEEHRVDVTALVERKRSEKEKTLLRAGEAEVHESRLDALEAELNDAFERSSLPDSPTTLSALDDYVVRTCRELGDG